MKTLILLCALISTSAHAVNVGYMRVTSQVTGDQAFLYTTNEQNDLCSGDWYVAKITGRDGATDQTAKMCWSMVGIDDNGKLLSNRVYDVEHNVIADHVHMTLVPSAISKKALIVILDKAEEANAKLLETFIRESSPHP